MKRRDLGIKEKRKKETENRKRRRKRYEKRVRDDREGGGWAMDNDGE